MKKKLLCLFLLMSLSFYSQVANEVHCAGETTFNLTNHNSLLIGNLNPTGTTVSYHLSASHAVESNWSYFTMYQFGWDEKMVGISLGVVGVLVSLVQGGLIRWTSRKLGNEKSIYIGMTLYTIGMFLFAFASQSWMMFLFLIPYCLAGIAGPALRAIISNHVLPTEQGEIQGTIASLMSAATIVGPPVMSSLFYYFTHKDAPFEFAGMPFVLGGLLMMISGIFAYFSLKKYATSNTNSD